MGMQIQPFNSGEKNTCCSLGIALKYALRYLYILHDHAVNSTYTTISMVPTK